MKADLNIRIFFIILFLSLISITFYSTATNAQPGTTVSRNDPECNGNGGTITPAAANNRCEFTPDAQKITFYRLDLCTSRPTGPTTSAQVVRTNCSTFFKNDSGSETTVVKGTGTQIGTAADYTALPYGNYTFAIVTMGSTFKFTTSQLFDATMSDRSNTSTTCVTKVSSLGTIYGFENRINTAAKSNVDCTSGATAAETTIGVNTLTMDSDDDCYHAVTFQGTSVNIDAYLVESDLTLLDGVGATDTDQIKNGIAGCTGGADHDIARIIGVMPLATTMKITPQTTGLQIKYNNTRGITKSMTSTTNMIGYFDSAYFDFDLIAR
ncbi:hypothetical protein PB7211_1156 [Candidatus Pelagibacter sp. HTCC7211]|uniref:hypothetical protein n=1 Tax=Pelagibacter sp. (strain HTCC7211) TaxID=439493 RepID=UPI0001838CFB|nr:hypothetical protein [Candidatus Pelagibacter sp. HTCC7211]EDZ60833.1 hypothetical protein PB7211_1156 [Candidatus Pelagibacter sp. HTCC7211]MBD1151319.1 hypothetical protein [Pelagibacterales bacterium SAG-MED25]